MENRLGRYRLVRAKSWRSTPLLQVEHSDEDEASGEMDTGDREASRSADEQVEVVNSSLLEPFSLGLQIRSESPEASERVGQGSEQKFEL